jgi:hypothetical protein
MVGVVVVVVVVVCFDIFFFILYCVNSVIMKIHHNKVISLKLNDSKA